MPFDPNADKDWKALYAVAKNSRRLQKPFLERHLESVKELVGHHYSDDGTTKPRPINMIELIFSVLAQNLVASVPQVNITSAIRALRADASSFQLMLNKHLREGSLVSDLEVWLMEAIFSPMGVMKLALDAQDITTMDGMPVLSGMPKVSCVLFDDWIQDMRANSPWNVAFCGDRYYVSEEFARANFDPDLVERLPQAEAKEEEETNLQQLTRDNTWDQSDYRKMKCVWDLWLPDEGLVLTVPGDFEQVPPLRIVEWIGPKRGPYHRLFFGPIPGNPLPLPPVALWRDLHETVNTLANKLDDQADRQKKIVGVETQHKDDVETLKATPDGHAAALNSLTSTKELNFGGIDNPTFGYMMQSKSTLDWLAGNISTLGGLAAASGTARQDEMLGASASQRIKRMQSKVYAATQGLIEDIGWYVWSDMTLEAPITKPIAGTNEVIETTWRRDQMRGGPEDYQITIEPYSMQRRSPQERLAQVVEFWERMVLPAAQLLMAQGRVPNFEAVHKIYMKLADLPELEDMVLYLTGEMDPAGGGSADAGGMPANTHRVHERHNTGSTTQQSAEDQMIQRLMSSGGQAQSAQSAG